MESVYVIMRYSDYNNSNYVFCIVFCVKLFIKNMNYLMEYL